MFFVPDFFEVMASVDKSNKVEKPSVKQAVYFKPKVETHKGKQTARVTKSYRQSDNSVIKLTKRINKDFSTSCIFEFRY